jgi:hypothetical protein
MKNLIILATAFYAASSWGQDSLVEWADINGTDAVAGGSAGQVLAVRGAITPFPSRVDFDAQFPVAGQSCEDFETNLFNDGEIIGFPAPLDATTDNAQFAAGSIIPGLTIQDNPLNDAGGGSASGLVAVGATTFGSPSDIVLANTFVDSLDLLIAPGISAVAMDVFSFTAGGTATVTFFDATDTQIGSIDVAAGPAAGGFIGVSSPVAIARINIISRDGAGADEAEGADNICLAAGGPDIPETAPVPAMSAVGLAAMALLLAVLAMVVLRGRQRV